MFKVGNVSPWGVIDRALELAPGIVSMTTDSHGGIWLSPERVMAMPQALARVKTFVERSLGAQPSPGRWYQEDCGDVSLVALAWPELFPREYIRVARLIGAKAHVTVAAWLDSLPANHRLNCYPGAPAVEKVPDSAEFQLTGSDRAADSPGQLGMF